MRHKASVKYWCCCNMLLYAINVATSRKCCHDVAHSSSDGMVNSNGCVCEDAQILLLYFTAVVVFVIAVVLVCESSKVSPYVETYAIAWWPNSSNKKVNLSITLNKQQQQKKFRERKKKKKDGTEKEDKKKAEKRWINALVEWKCCFCCFCCYFGVWQLFISLFLISLLTITNFQFNRFLGCHFVYLLMTLLFQYFSLFSCFVMTLIFLSNSHKIWCLLLTFVKKKQQQQWNEMKGDANVVLKKPV